MTRISAAPGFMFLILALLLQQTTATAANAMTTSAAEPKSKHPRPVTYLRQLQVNTENSERYVTVGVSEADGIRNIQSILMQSRFEEMWVYVPAADPSGSGQWHEIGRDEKSGAKDARVRIDWEYLAFLMSRESELNVYHFHPLAYFECHDWAVCAEQLQSQERPAASDARIISNLIFSMPSPADIHFMMETTWQLHQHHPDGGVIRHRVITPHGMVEYALTEAGFDKYASDRGARTQGLYIKWVAASKLGDDRVRAIVDESAGDFSGALRRLVESLNTRFLRVIYFPRS